MVIDLGIEAPPSFRALALPKIEISGEEMVPLRKAHLENLKTEYFRRIGISERYSTDEEIKNCSDVNELRMRYYWNLSDSAGSGGGKKRDTMCAAIYDKLNREDLLIRDETCGNKTKTVIEMPEEKSTISAIDFPLTHSILTFRDSDFGGKMGKIYENIKGPMLGDYFTNWNTVGTFLTLLKGRIVVGLCQNPISNSIKYFAINPTYIKQEDLVQQRILPYFRKELNKLPAVSSRGKAIIEIPVNDEKSKAYFSKIFKTQEVRSGQIIYTI